MDKREHTRAPVAIEVEISRDGLAPLRGSLLDVSSTGVRIAYVNVDVLGAEPSIAQLRVGDEVTIRGFSSHGRLELHGRVKRVDADTAELGIELRDGSDVHAVRAWLDSPLVGGD